MLMSLDRAPQFASRRKAGLHADRAAGRHRHHRRPDRPAPARRAGRPRGRPAQPVRQQPEAVGLAMHNYHDVIGTLPPGTSAPAGTTSAPGMLLPYMEQGRSTTPSTSPALPGSRHGQPRTPRSSGHDQHLPLPVGHRPADQRLRAHELLPATRGTPPSRSDDATGTALNGLFASVNAAGPSAPRHHRRPEQHGRLQREGQGDRHRLQRLRLVNPTSAVLSIASRRRDRDDQRLYKDAIPQVYYAPATHTTRRTTALATGAIAQGSSGGTATTRPASTTTSCRRTPGAATTTTSTTAGASTASSRHSGGVNVACATARSASSRDLITTGVVGDRVPERRRGRRLRINSDPRIEPGSPPGAAPDPPPEERG